jgi:hypothetical protein
MKAIHLLSIFLFASTLAQAQLDFGPASKSVEEAKASLDGRRASFFTYHANLPLKSPPIPPKAGLDEFMETMISRMALRVDLENVSKNIMTESFHPWNPGTEISLLGSVCRRMGDYDFVLMGLVTMAYMDEDAGQTLLTPEARNKLRHELLSQTGIEHHTGFKLENCLPIKIKDTENHILMTETARYLTNQLLLRESIAAGKRDDSFDNQKNGFEEWFLNHLSQFLRTDFDELNSRPYQAYTIIALSTLHSHADGERVKTVTKMILDYISTKVALQSMGLRRHTPFRRRLEYRETKYFTDADHAMSWFAFHAGNHDFTDLARDEKAEDERIDHYPYVMAASDKYEIPEMIHEMFFHRSTPVFQIFNGRDPEAYFLSENFVLAAGGRHRNVFGYYVSQENDVWAVPTNIIPRSSALGLKQVFSMTGEPKWKKRNNLCVAPNFACGKNLVIPSQFADKGIQNGAWTFYETPDFQLAIYKVGEYAFWEVQERGNFTEFMASVLKLNANEFSPNNRNIYKTSTGTVIEFDWKVKKLDQNPIVSINGEVQIANTSQWPLARGPVVNSLRDGKISIRSIDGSRERILDQSDILNPKIIER